MPGSPGRVQGCELRARLCMLPRAPSLWCDLFVNPGVTRTVCLLFQQQVAPCTAAGEPVVTVVSRRVTALLLGWMECRKEKAEKAGVPAWPVQEERGWLPRQPWEPGHRPVGPRGHPHGCLGVWTGSHWLSASCSPPALGLLSRTGLFREAWGQRGLRGARCPSDPGPVGLCWESLEGR